MVTSDHPVMPFSHDNRMQKNKDVTYGINHGLCNPATQRTKERSQPVLAAIVFALATLGFVSPPIGQQGLLNDVPMLTTVKLLHFIPSNTTHSPARARRSVAMHNLVQVRKQN